MRKVWMMASAAVAIMTTAALNASAGTYIPVPMVPGAVSEIVFGINDSNVVAGSFRDSANVEHGFFGPLDGSNWTVFDAPFDGTTGTEARYINDHGAITGIAINPNFKVGEEFYRSPKGKFKVFSLNGQPLDGVAQGMNSSGASVGDYINAEGKTVGYIGQNGKYVEDFKLHLKGNKNFLQVSPRGIDEFDQTWVGLFVDQSGILHGFRQTRNVDGRYSVGQIDYPDAKATALEDVAESGIFPGQWTDTDGNVHAFFFDLKNHKGPFIDLDPGDGSTSQQAWGANKHGFIALSTDAGSSYIYCPKNQAEKCPSGGPVNRVGVGSLP